MKANLFIILFYVSVCLSCSSNKLHQTWIPVFIEEDLEFKMPINKNVYGITLNFLNDSVIKYHNIKSDIKKNIRIEYISDKRFKVLKNDRKYFDHEIEKLSEDSLTIRYVSSIKKENGFIVKYVPLPISKVTSSINELKFLLINNFWEYKIGDLRYELEFNYNIKEDRGWHGNYKTGYTCFIHVFEKGQYEGTISGFYWSLVKIDNNYILHIGDNLNSSDTFQTFYITSISDKNFNTLAWYQNKKAEINFKKLPYQVNKWNANYNSLTSKNWTVSKTDILKHQDPFMDSLEYILRRFNTWDTVDTELVINEFDLNAKLLTYSFKRDKTYKLYKSNKVIQNGKWNLFPNGKVISLLPDDKEKRNKQEVYSIPGAYMYIIDSKEGEFVIDRSEEVYINDTTFITKQTTQYWK